MVSAVGAVGAVGEKTKKAGERLLPGFLMRVGATP